MFALKSFKQLSASQSPRQRILTTRKTFTENHAEVKTSQAPASSEKQQQPQSPPAKFLPLFETQEVAAGPDLYSRIADNGAMKAGMTVTRTLLLAILGGVYVGFGAWLALTVGGNVPGLMETNPGLQRFIYGAFGFPLGLTMIAVLGAELVTGNAAFVSIAAFEKRADLKGLLKNWITTYIGNWMGTLLLVSLIVAGGMIGPSLAGWPRELALGKVYNYTFQEIFVRGILCNMLVSSAVALAAASRSLVGKVVGIFLPNSAFAALGLEHCVANMFIIEVAMAGGAAITWRDFILNNLVPATLGNLVGGAIFFAATYALIYGRPSVKAGISPAPPAKVLN